MGATTVALCVLATLALSGVGRAQVVKGQAVDASGAPQYRVDPFWPKPLPNKWSMQQVVGIWVDQMDHVWFLNRGVAFGYVTIVIAHIMFQISFVAVTVRARIRGFDWTLEQAAMDLGATPSRAFWKITFPLILPGILAAALLSFALSIDDFIITFFNAGSLVTFPLQIFGASRVKIPPQINVLATFDGSQVSIEQEPNPLLPKELADLFETDELKKYFLPEELEQLGKGGH